MIILLLESTGIPIANTTLLLFTGALASLGHLNIWVLTIAAILGSILGACIAYILGAQLGRQIFLRLKVLFNVLPFIPPEPKARRFRSACLTRSVAQSALAGGIQSRTEGALEGWSFYIDPEKASLSEHWFQKSGLWMVFFSRMIPYVRPFACFPAGISRMPILRFFLAASAGSILWCVGMLYLGWVLGPRWQVALYLVQSYTFPTLGIAAVIIVAYLLIKHTIKRYLLLKLQS